MKYLIAVICLLLAAYLFGEILGELQAEKMVSEGLLDSDSPMIKNIEMFPLDEKGNRTSDIPDCAFKIWIWQVDDVEEIAK